ncbi:holin [Flexivirga sp.]|uniref:holin n=1 Tax=Flexivirga sp. TaxID=1962927 RepID=UPI003F7E817E
MSNLTSKAFWEATGERVVSSVAGGALGVLGAGAVGALDVDWQNVASVAVGAGIVSLLKALAASSVNGDGPSLTRAETTTQRGPTPVE